MKYLNRQKLKQLRELRGWDQKHLALCADVDASVISRLERGLQNDVRLSVVIAITQALGVAITDILDEEFQSLEREFSPALMIALAELNTLSTIHQTHISNIILAYIASIREIEDAGESS